MAWPDPSNAPTQQDTDSLSREAPSGTLRFSAQYAKLFFQARNRSTAPDLNLREQFPEFDEGLFRPNQQPVQFIPLGLNAPDVAAQLAVNLRVRHLGCLVRPHIASPA